ncbi:MAG TPA: hypothetical protein EYN51_10795 [Flavobacteriales bacterium]|nr:hypothetical protein [Flavobacteriales bacterium]HIA12382.1 hypothetical protein [Flavobacteriales bacterium]
MSKLLYTLSTFLILFCAPMSLRAQEEDLMSMLEEDTEPIVEKVTATFKALTVINANTIETVKAKTLVFNIIHRFGNVAEGAHTLAGMDNASNIRFAFDYGVTDKLLIGIGRSKVKEHIDGSIKYKILAQTTDNKMPITMVWYSGMAVTPMQSPRNADGSEKWSKAAHRFSYIHQLIIARKFSSAISFEILPTYSHRNYIVRNVNPDNGAEEQNDLFSIGIAGRVKVNNRLSIVGDYFYTFSKYRNNNSASPHYMPLGLGIEIETGGHIFHINLTNSPGIIGNDYIPDTEESWIDGDIKLGFNIARVFYL